MLKAISLFVLFLTVSPQLTFAEINCDEMNETICTTASTDLSSIARDEVKAAIKKDAIQFTGMKAGQNFENFQDFVFFKSKRENLVPAAQILIQYQVCVNAMVLELYEGRIPKANSVCANMGSSLSKLSSFIGAKVKASKLNGEFQIAKNKMISFFKTHQISTYLNLLEVSGTHTNFDDYLSSAVLITPFENINDSAIGGFVSACGEDGMTFNAYNAADVQPAFSTANQPIVTLKTQVAYCPGYIMAMINVKNQVSPYSLPTDTLRLPKNINLSDYEFSNAPENGNLVLYHELAHCVTNFHRFKAFSDKVGSTFLACFKNNFLDSFKYKDYTVQQSSDKSAKPTYETKKDAQLFIEETLADHLAIKALAQDLKASNAKYSLLVNNANTYCSFGKNEPLFDPYRRTLHPSGKFRLNQIGLNASIRKSLGCAPIAKSERCDYMDGFKQ